MKHIPTYGEFMLNEAANINDPVLMAFRAAKMKREKELAKPKRRSLYGKQREKAEDELWDISQELKDLYADRGQMLIDMEQEAEVEGGPIADEYGDKLNKIEDEIQKLIAKRSRLEIRLAEQFEYITETMTDESEDFIFEGDVNYKSDKFALVRKGGSIGSKSEYPVFMSGKMASIIETSNDKEALKEKAKRMTKSLSPGERKYYGVGYSVIEITPKRVKEIDNLIDLRKSSENDNV